MSEDNLPAEVGVPDDSELAQISDRLQEMNQTIQEQAFLLGYRNGYREGDLVQALLHWVRKQQADADNQDVLNAWRDVEHHLVSNGAYLQESEEREITFPPGLNLYLGASDCRPHIQVAGQRVNVADLHFQWEPNPQDPDADQFEPKTEHASIEIEAHLELPEDSEQREALLQFLRGLQG